MMKVRLSATKEMAADGEPDKDDEIFLAERDASFPLTMTPAGSLDLPVASTPAKEINPAKKSTAKGFSDIKSTYGLRGREFVEKLTTPAKKAFANLSITPKTTLWHRRNSIRSRQLLRFA